MTSLIDKANAWATQLWADAVPQWQTREQDHAYRDLVVRPHLGDLLRTLPIAVRARFFVDYGCGDGSETHFMHDILARAGHQGFLYGFDPQEGFGTSRASSAKERLMLEFYRGNKHGFLGAYALSGRSDLVTSLFVLQDTPDLGGFLADISGCLRSKDAQAVFVLVDPDFGLAMRAKGALKVEESLGACEGQYEFAGHYPIVEKNGGTFYVPYFHRSREEYRRKLLAHFEQVREVRMAPSKSVIADCERTERSPFFNHDGNVYYPEIVDVPSSLILHATR